MQNRNEQQLKNEIKKCNDKINKLYSPERYTKLVTEVISVLNDKIRLVGSFMIKKIEASALPPRGKESYRNWVIGELDRITTGNDNTVRQFAQNIGTFISNQIDQNISANTFKFNHVPISPNADRFSRAWIEDIYREATSL